MKNDMMKYKGYKASISYDEMDRIFVGEVFGISDSLNFHGSSIDELEQSFHNCIDNYIDYCASIGKEPQRAFTGNFNVRTTPSIHAQASEYAAENGMSLNQVVTKAMEFFLKKNYKKA
ncbi:MAG: type II toxin-antitoxin system HicB family antitoxin [Lachnospiraceae bacterium]|nr:type II toxin-antitoxin system HicB family antitoxin [Lachnospiraceae bacterium]